MLRQPIAFFTRAQTGALVTRLNNDVIGAQQAFTSVLSSVVSNVISLVLIVVAMASLSWQLTLAALALLPFFLIPARLMGRRLAGLTHDSDGAQRRDGHPDDRALQRRRRPARQALRPPGRRGRGVRRAGRPGSATSACSIALNRTVFFVALTLVASLATAMVYGFGGVMAVNGTLTVGTLLALAALLARLYGPLTALSNVRVDVMTALVSFERVFEVLDLEPLVTEARRRRRTSRTGPLRVELDDVGFRYPSADEVSLASLETVASGDRAGGGAGAARRDLHASRPASSSPSSARAAPARRPSPPRGPPLRPHAPAASASAASTCATPP